MMECFPLHASFGSSINICINTKPYKKKHVFVVVVFLVVVAMNLSFSGRSHVGRFFANAEQIKDGW